MKKTILTIVALLSTIGVAKPLNYDYANAFNKLNPITLSEYNKVDLKLINSKQTGVGLLNGDGTGLTSREVIATGKYLVPKALDNHNVAIFTHTDPNFNNTGSASKLITNNGGAIQTLDISLIKDGNYNNNPIFIYAYDKNTNTIHKIYKEDGTRAVIRQINSEDVDGKLTKEVVDNSTFKLGNGYIEANDLYKLMIGEIKDNDPEKTEVTDRSRYGVSGKTVYKYIEKLRKEFELKIKELEEKINNKK